MVLIDQISVFNVQVKTNTQNLQRTNNMLYNCCNYNLATPFFKQEEDLLDSDFISAPVCFGRHEKGETVGNHRSEPSKEKCLILAKT